MLARMTLLALYDYDESLFDGLELPDGISKENVVNATLDKGAIFGCMYTNPMFLKRYIETWSKRHYSMFQRWIEVLEKEYEPIRDYYIHRVRDIVETGSKESNEEKNEDTMGNLKGKKTYERDRKVGEEENIGKDRTVKEEENIEREEKETTVKDYDEKGSGEHHETNGNVRDTEGSHSKTINESGSSSATQEEKVSAFDSSSYSPKTMTTTNSSDSRNTSESGNETGKITDSGTKDYTEKSGKEIDEKDTKEGSETTKRTDDTTETDVTKRTDNVTEDIDDVSNYEEGTTGNRVNNNHAKIDSEDYQNLVDKVVATKGERSVQDLIIEELELRKFEICEKIADILVADICIMVY